MKLSNHRKCDKCGILYDKSPFANMLANGEATYSYIEIRGCIRFVPEVFK